LLLLDGCEKLAPLIVPDLRRIAKHHLDRERSGHSLQTTALVNEAYLRLVGMKKVHWKDRAHFFAASAQMVRHILVDAARARRSRKRGGYVVKVTLTDALAVSDRRTPFAQLAAYEYLGRELRQPDRVNWTVGRFLRV